MTTRREFVTGAAVAGTIAATPAIARTGKKKKMLIINALGDLDNPNLALAQPQSDNPVDLDKRRHGRPHISPTPAPRDLRP